MRFVVIILLGLVLFQLFGGGEVYAAGCDQFNVTPNSINNLFVGNEVNIRPEVTPQSTNDYFAVVDVAGSVPSSDLLSNCRQAGGAWICKVAREGTYSAPVKIQVTSKKTFERETCWKSIPIQTVNSIKPTNPQNPPAQNGTNQNESENKPIAGVPGLEQLQMLTGNLFRALGVIIFFALVVMLVVGGIKFLTSGGEAKSLQSAQQTITWAILGILFLVLAWLFLLLVANFTGQPQLLRFNLEGLFPGTPIE